MWASTAGWRRPVLAVSVGLPLLAFAVTLATPYADLPVGTATATGASMGYEGMQVVVYADTPLATVDVGGPVIYRDGDRLVHHRVVGHTPRGYVTKGDAVTTTDQAQGAPYVTSANLVGVVVLRLSLPTAIRLTAVCVVLWGTLCWRLRSRWGWPERA